MYEVDFSTYFQKCQEADKSIIKVKQNKWGLIILNQCSKKFEASFIVTCNCAMPTKEGSSSQKRLKRGHSFVIFFFLPSQKLLKGKEKKKK